MGIGTTLIIMALVARLLITFYSAPITTNCTTGTLAAGGSTALLPLVSLATQEYHVMCPQTTFTVNQNAASSEDGLWQVGHGQIAIGDSDLQSSNLQLVDHPVAVVTFVLILNQDVSNIRNLTKEQIQSIYNGSISNWNQIGGPDLPIFVVNRTSTSGTLVTFEHYILNGRETFPSDQEKRYIEVGTASIMASTVASTAGAIGYVDVGTATQQAMRTVAIDGVEALPTNVENGSYRFWTIEHMYTKRNPSDLTRAFLKYMTGDQVKVLINYLHYLPINELPSNLVQNHPSPTARDGL